MALTNTMVRDLLRHAGVTATTKQVESTANLYKTLTDQLANKVPIESLEDIEPQYIQQPRRPRRS